MSVGNALVFIRRFRSEADLRGRLPGAAADDRLAALCALATAEGLSCEPGHVREAFRIEWTARLAHFSRRVASPRQVT
jgi:hypothetical protein